MVHYLIGILMGIYLKTKKAHLLKHQWQAILGWAASLLVIALLIALSYVLRDIPDQPSVPHAAYRGFTAPCLRSAWLDHPGL
ncbi:hypothetical protein SKAU_G00357550 [Synaphobranchus kaupii]|uniref:Uncharacterized protein n=1 Tax=Synaphobranchus kaupii TaxID=118154 RepID=A0A9Q1IGR9_SYNKA|nr:hypothetical protein SKAU_G00357550 [Synaphobranchus kaupii]